jgi:glycosyltransferase involved in cell wall biosynthesis
MTASCTVVVPCFNEAQRLDPAHLDKLIESADVRILAVDDGSTDTTAALLDNLAGDDPDRISVLALGTNRGKGEAVRLGLLDAIAGGAELVAYCDADFATPPGEVARLVAALRSDAGVDAVLGSRVAMMGCDIKRSAFRHYAGRLFATAGSLVLGVPVYDTQCGAKAFRVTNRLSQALATPFASRWAFDIELLGRLLQPRRAAATEATGRFIELPLRHWSDPGGSKMTARAGLRAGVDLVRISRALRRTDASIDRLDEERDGA